MEKLMEHGKTAMTLVVFLLVVLGLLLALNLFAGVILYAYSIVPPPLLVVGIIIFVIIKNH